MKMSESKNIVDTAVIGGIVSSAILVDLNISMWAGRKTAKGETRKVVADAGAKSSDAAHVTKKLFVDNPLFAEISKKGNVMRAYVLDNTLPWMGDLKLLPVSSFERFQETMNAYKADFDAAVDAFCNDYSVQVSAMAFKLGNLFDRNEYPEAWAIREKFKVEWVFSPVPTSGDFRVDAENSLRNELKEAYETAMQQRIEASMRSMWEKLKSCLEHMVDRLAVGEDGKPNVFHGTLTENAKELVNLLKDFNITGDPNLEAARSLLMAAIDNVEPDELRKNMAVRNDVRESVKSILSKFDF